MQLKVSPWYDNNYHMCFNTVNGKYCSTDRTAESVRNLYKGFNTVNGKYCCNTVIVFMIGEAGEAGFNTVNGKYCCNAVRSAFFFNTMLVSIP